MPFEQLFGNRITPACKYCMNGRPGGIEGEYLCLRHGVVAAEYKCRHYEYDPVSRIPKRPLKLENFDAESFSID